MANIKTDERVPTSSEAPQRGALNEDDRAWLRALVTRVGETEAARRVGLSRGVVGRALAGLPVYAGTQALITFARAQAAKRG